MRAEDSGPLGRTALRITGPGQGLASQCTAVGRLIVFEGRDTRPVQADPLPGVGPRRDCSNAAVMTRWRTVWSFSGSNSRRPSPCHTMDAG